MKNTRAVLILEDITDFSVREKKEKLDSSDYICRLDDRILLAKKVGYASIDNLILTQSTNSSKK